MSVDNKQADRPNQEIDLGNLSLSWKTKVVLAAGSLICSLLLAAAIFFFIVIPYRTKGTQFANLDELRKAMLKGGEFNDPAQNSSSRGYVSANLRGLVTPHSSDDIIFDLLPKLDLTFQRVAVRTNSCGMRNPETTIAKPGDTFRIAVLGDSFTFGWGVKQEETFAQVLEDNLNRLSQGSPHFEVLNFGIPGYSTFQEVAKFEEIGLSFEPDAVLVFFVENDFGLPFYVKDIYNPGSILSAVSFAQLSWKESDAKIEEQKLRMTKYDPNKALMRVSSLCRQLHIPLYVTINPKKDWKSHKKRLWVLKKDKDIKFIDTRDQFVKMVEKFKIAEEDLTLSFDPHPSPLRHKLYGYLLTAPFMEFIR